MVSRQKRLNQKLLSCLTMLHEKEWLNADQVPQIKSLLRNIADMINNACLLYKPLSIVHPFSLSLLKNAQTKNYFFFACCPLIQGEKKTCVKCKNQHDGTFSMSTFPPLRKGIFSIIIATWAQQVFHHQQFTFSFEGKNLIPVCNIGVVLKT